MLAAFLGFELIRRVSPLLHTPLMSLTNAISAIAVVGAILITGAKDASTLSRVLGFIAVVASTVNLVSGYLITDRMLKMFKKRGPGEEMIETIFPILYILAAAGFILAIKWMNSPATARRGVIVGEMGMLLAVVGTLLRYEVVNYEWILIAFFVGSAIGVPIAYIMPMTAVPQRTAFSHACGALASALIGTAEYYRHMPHGFVMAALVLETLLGFLTCTASLMAFGKLQEILPAGRSLTGQNFVNLGVFGLGGGHRHRAGHLSRADLAVSDFHGTFAGVWRAADCAHRRRGHADRDCAAEFLCRACRRAPWDSRWTTSC